MRKGDNVISLFTSPIFSLQAFPYNFFLTRLFCSWSQFEFCCLHPCGVDYMFFVVCFLMLENEYAIMKME